MLKICRLSESNRGHKDFQSFALPTELKRRNDLVYTLYKWGLSTPPSKFTENLGNRAQGDLSTAEQSFRTVMHSHKEGSVIGDVDHMGHVGFVSLHHLHILVDHRTA